MQINLKMTGLEAVQKQLAALGGPKLREAQAKALTDTAFKVRGAMKDEFKSVFDRVTPYILKSVYVKPATPDNLVAIVEPTYYGEKGADPQQVLRAQEQGGTRRDKRSEVALRRVGILPPGFQTTLPRSPFPGSDDGMGNIKGSFVVQLISYFQAFGEQGYRANMTNKRKANLKKGSAKQTGRRYFVAYGKLRDGSRETKSGELDQRVRNLGPGIWAASGTGSCNIQPVLMFVRTPTYKPRISLERIGKAADVDNYLASRMRYRIRQAAGV